MDFVRITVGDAKVCDDCIRLEPTPPASMEWWGQSGLKPRVAPTACKLNCRCGLVPADVTDLQAEAARLIDQVVDNAFGSGVKIDLTAGRRVLLKEFEQIEGMLTEQYFRIAQMENLILFWKVENGGAKLPGSFFRISNIDGMIDWLESEIKGVIEIVERQDVLRGGL